MLKKTNNNELDYKTINEVAKLSKNILSIGVILTVILAIYVFTLIFKEWKIGSYILAILSILSPLIIGVVIAWLFDPIVSWFKKKGLKRSIGAIITYLIFFSIIALVLGTLIPLLSTQINELVKIVPSIVSSVQEWTDNIFNRLGDIEGFDAVAFQAKLFEQLDLFRQIGYDIPEPEEKSEQTQNNISVLSSLVIASAEQITSSQIRNAAKKIERSISISERKESTIDGRNDEDDRNQ